MTQSFPSQSFAGRTLLCTGASGGIGLAICKAYAASGGHVIATDITLLHDLPEGAAAHVCDITQEDAVAALMADAASGGLDHIVHAAGKVEPGPLKDQTLVRWQRAMDVNLTSAFLLARAAEPHLAARKGSFVFLSSSNGLNGGSALSGPGYGAAKAGLINFARYLAREWAPLGVRVNAIAPGPVDTPMLDRFSDTEKAALAGNMLTGALTTAEEIAAAALYLLSGDARSMTGTVHNMTGGLVL